MPYIQRRYKRAPITEAVIELRIRSDSPAESSGLKGLAEELADAYPKQAPMQLVHVGIPIGPGQPPETRQQVFSQKQMGFRLAREDGLRVLQIRNDALAYSHLAPYTHWTAFRDEAKPLWEKYRRVFPTAKVTRCALRYINRVDIPDPRIEVEDYFRLYPEVPGDLPQKDVISMAMNIQIPQTDLGCLVTINQGLVDPPQPGVISVLLDIDIFRLGTESWQDAEIWEFLEKLRVRKNEIFESCITDRTRELIDR